MLNRAHTHLQFVTAAQINHKLKLTDGVVNTVRDMMIKVMPGVSEPLYSVSRFAGSCSASSLPAPTSSPLHPTTSRTHSGKRNKP